MGYGDSHFTYIAAKAAFYTGKEVILLSRLFIQAVFKEPYEHVHRYFGRTNPDALPTVNTWVIT
jgi:hypothetical protein